MSINEEAGGGRVSINRATVEGMLDHEWQNRMDDASPTGIAFGQGVVEAARYMGLISNAEAEAWTARMTRCPGAEDAHYGGRVWCSFCGDINEEGDPVQKVYTRPECIFNYCPQQQICQRAGKCSNASKSYFANESPAAMVVAGGIVPTNDRDAR